MFSSIKSFKSFAFAKALMLIACGLVASSTSYAQAASWSPVKIGSVRPPDGRPCTFFSIVDFNTGAPITSPQGTTWFVIPQSFIGYKENLANLLIAKVTGQSVFISGSGLNSSCGTYQADVVVLN